MGDILWEKYEAKSSRASACYLAEVRLMIGTADEAPKLIPFTLFVSLTIIKCHWPCVLKYQSRQPHTHPIDSHTYLAFITTENQAWKQRSALGEENSVFSAGNEKCKKVPIKTSVS